MTTNLGEIPKRQPRGKTLRRRIESGLPAICRVTPVSSDVDVPPAVREASDALAQAIALHEAAAAALADQDHAAALVDEQNAAIEAFREAHWTRRAAAIGLIAATYGARDEWLARLEQDERDAVQHVDRALAQVAEQARRAAVIRGLREIVQETPSPRSGTVKHGHTGLQLDGGRGSDRVDPDLADALGAARLVAHRQHRGQFGRPRNVPREERVAAWMAVREAGDELGSASW